MAQTPPCRSRLQHRSAPPEVAAPGGRPRRLRPDDPLVSEQTEGDTTTRVDSISWNNPGETFHSGIAADFRTCPDVDIRDEDGDEYHGNPIPDRMTSAVASPDETVTGAIGDCTTRMDDSYTVTVPPMHTIEVSVDVTDPDRLFDPRLWVDDPDGCTISRADDLFQCSAGPCEAGWADRPCCPATKFTNLLWGTTTFTIFVAHAAPWRLPVLESVLGIDAYQCYAPDKTGPYTLAVKDETAGGATLTVDHDDYDPTITMSFSGSATVTTTTTRTPLPSGE